MLKSIFITFLVSMIPVIELRGAIPIGTGLGLNPFFAALIAFVGNIIPVYFILTYIPKLLAFMREKKYTKKFATWLDKKVHKNRHKIDQYGYFGLIVLVAVPLPGTGAWTGALVASCLEMDKKPAFFSIAIGIFMAAVIVLGITYGFTAIF